MSVDVRLYGSISQNNDEHADSVYLRQEKSSGCSTLDKPKAVAWPAVVLKVGLAASVLFVGMYKILYSGHIATFASESALSGQVADVGFKEIFSLKVYNADYEGDLTAMSYPFLATGLLAEPQRSTTIEASIGDGIFGKCTYEIALEVGGGPWDDTPGVVAAKDFKPSGSLNHTDVVGKRTATVMFPSPGTYECTLSCERVEYSDLSTNLSQKITVYYIRRELRSLRDPDRVDFLHCFEQMMHLDSDTGKKMYGPHFKSLSEFEMMHLNNAGARHADHFHDGMGLTTQHVAMSSEFELCMQTIKPHIALPYWDYTIDGNKIQSMGNIVGRPDDERSIFVHSELFTEKWFGNTNSEANVVTKGPFAYQEIPRSYRNFTTRSAYGFLRAPWNINPNKYVTRYHKICGSKVDPDSDGTPSALQWPTCAVHFAVTNTAFYDDWYTWAMNIGYMPHGPVHSWVGGVGGMCDTTWDALYEDKMINADVLKNLKYYSFYMLKNMWRDYVINTPEYCSPDTNVSQCMWVCADDHLTNEDVFSFFVDTIGISEDDTNLNTIINRVMCETPFWPGDHLEAASPVDISFWPIHPTIERLLQYKDLVRPFTNNSWPENISALPVCDYPTTSNCRGHNSYDLTKFRATFYNATLGAYTQRTLTNEELRSKINPVIDYSNPFIFDNFQWKHCEGNASFKSVNGSSTKTSDSALF